jgi:hypothetical protein
MKPFYGIALVLGTVIVAFTAAVLGMIRHNVLLDPTRCCLADTACEEKLKKQLFVYYAPVTGLRTRYIVTIVFFFVAVVLRCFSFPERIKIIQSKFVVVFAALTTYTTLLFFTNTSMLMFTESASFLLPECNAVSTLTTDAIAVLTWFIFIAGVILFYIFIYCHEKYDHSTYMRPVIPFHLSDSDEGEEGDDDEETILKKGSKAKKIVKVAKSLL